MSLTAPSTEPETASSPATYPEPFAGEIARAQAGIIAAAELLDATGVIAHARAMRSAIYRAGEDARRIW